MQNDVYKGASSYDRSVYATWDLSYNALVSSSNLNALWVLKCFAFFHNENISIDIFRFAAENLDKDNSIDQEKLEQADYLQYFPRDLFRLTSDGEWDSLTFGRSISTLLEFSLVRKDESGRYFSMHRLVHEWIYDILGEDDKMKHSYSSYSVLGSSGGWGEKMEDYNFRRTLLPHISTCQGRTPLTFKPNISAKVKLKIARTFRDAGRWTEAEKLQSQAVETRQKILGKEHLGTTISMGNLALTYSEQGRWIKAEELELQVMEIRKRVLETKHSDTLLAMGNLALTYFKQGRWTKAEKLELQVMEIRKENLGTEHPRTLLSMNNLAMTYSNQGRLEEAENLGFQVMQIRERDLRTEHPDTLISMNNLAITYSRQERLEEAENLVLQIMKVRKKYLGKEHPDTLLTMSNLAFVYHDQGRIDSAIELLTTVIELLLKTIGADHPDTIDNIDALNRWRNEKSEVSRED